MDDVTPTTPEARRLEARHDCRRIGAPRMRQVTLGGTGGWSAAVLGDAQESHLRLEVLGSLRVWRGDQPVNLGSVQQRVVLGVLALNANRPVSREKLIDAIWGTDAPAYAVNLVQKHMSGLRRALEPVRASRAPSRLLSWTDGGYLLSLPTDGLDLYLFDRGVSRARNARDTDDLGSAARSLHEALRLWRGPALDGLSSPFLNAERDRLTERRINALEERIDIDLAIGDEQDLVEELRSLVTRYPLRERLRGLLMRALYQAGRQGEALAAFREAREHLRAELGIEPTPELQALHKRVLSGDTTLQRTGSRMPEPEGAPAPAHPRPAQLPHSLPDFTGRESELDRLDGLTKSEETVMIAAITGTAGVGKTSLALHWAHESAQRFPDGQLYVNLRGFDPGGYPVPPGEVLRGFLDALGMPAQETPVTVEEQAARYRSILAGRRVLVVLDNARDTEQVSPLLPGTPGCVVVVTSRSRLSGLMVAGAVPVAMSLPSMEEATLLLSRRVGAERVAMEPEAAADIVAACARLPLALAIVAARITPYPHYRLSALAAELRQASGGLDALIGDNESRDARAVLSWSYHHLSEPAARLFRLLGLHPGPEITPPAAASLTGLPMRQARRMLTVLAGAHLLEEHTPGRFSFHDLLRAYAAEQAEEEESEPERHAAMARLLDHYLHTAHAADRLLYPYRDPIDVEEPDPAATVVDFTEPDAALSWFVTERPVLLSAIAWATGAGFPAHASRLTWTVTAFLNYQGKFHDWAAGLNAALLACRTLGDQPGEALAHQLLNVACRQQGLIVEAEAHANRALELFDRLGEAARQARLLLDLARLRERQGNDRQALDRASGALTLFRTVDDKAGEADALSWVGWYHSQLGMHAEALRYCHQALRLHQDLSGHPGEADTWNALGSAHYHLGHYDDAVTSHEQALVRWRELGDRYEMATTLVRLGDTLHAAGHADSARGQWHQAQLIFDDLGHPDGEQSRARLETRGADGAARERNVDV
ncbi:MAG: BTAD domain-containing putative transcriptional regulator [Actinomycetota bacterium]|nr:BTAD domain-containing putative transcriptional regulator [Actinomycetota bacterium]